MLKNFFKGLLFLVIVVCITFGIRYIIDNVAADTSVDVDQVLSQDTVTTEVITQAETTELLQETQESVTYCKFPDEFYPEINGVIKKYPQFETRKISFIFEDIESGYTYQVNPQYHYNIASVVKAPFCMYVYMCALEGKIDINQTFEFTEKYRMEGTGKIKEMDEGEVFTVEELIGYAIEESDNSAYAMLKEIVPEEEYLEYTKTLDNMDEESTRLYKREICNASANSYIKTIYNFIEQHNIYSDRLKEHMLNTRNAMIQSEYPVVRKYGWYDGNFHDMAVIYAPHPYTLTILANFEVVTDDEYQLFRDISAVIDKYSQQLVTTDVKSDEVIVLTTREIEENEFTEGSDNADELY